jgi:hypothetical protein
MHTASARKLGETEERLFLLDAWRESRLYSERERAALAWTEALTLVSEAHAPDDVYRALQAQFTEEEQATLTLPIVTINGWNRIQVDFRGVHPVDSATQLDEAKSSQDGAGAPAAARNAPASRLPRRSSVRRTAQCLRSSMRGDHPLIAGMPCMR